MATDDTAEQLAKVAGVVWLDGSVWAGARAVEGGAAGAAPLMRAQ